MPRASPEMPLRYPGSTLRLKEVPGVGPGVLVPVLGQSRDAGAGTMSLSRGLERNREWVPGGLCGTGGSVAAGASTGVSPAVRVPVLVPGWYQGWVQGSGSVPGSVPGLEAVSEVDPGVGADVRSGS